MGMETMNTKPPKTLIDAVRYFSDLDNALAYFVRRRWPDGITCPRCGGVLVTFQPKYQRWQCKGKHERKQFTIKTGTIMEDSPITLDKWAVAFWLEANAKNSISSYELHRALGITQKSAWFMLHRIRLALQTNSTIKLGGSGKIVEADETYIGGKARNMHKDKRDRVIGSGTGSVGKAIVAGLLERKTEHEHSKVRLAIIPATSRKHVHPHVRKHVEKDTQLFTDAHSAYTALGTDFAHAFVDHAERYVQGNVHTNGLENFWALLKRCIGGTHVNVEPFHLFRYLDSEAFRFNNRKMNDSERFEAALSGMAGKRLTFKALTGASGDAPATDSAEESESGAL